MAALEERVARALKTPTKAELSTPLAKPPQPSEVATAPVIEIEPNPNTTSVTASPPPSLAEQLKERQAMFAKQRSQESTTKKEDNQHEV